MEASTSGTLRTQIGVAVAVVVDGEAEVGRRQELGLAQLAGVGAAHLAEREVAALQEAQRREQLALEQLGATAVVRHGREHAEGRELAQVARAEIGLQSPDRDDHGRRHAVLPLDARQQAGVPLQHLLAARDAAGA